MNVESYTKIQGHPFRIQELEARIAVELQTLASAN
jgi:hypothetical protein